MAGVLGDYKDRMATDCQPSDTQARQQLICTHNIHVLHLNQDGNNH